MFSRMEEYCKCNIYTFCAKYWILLSSLASGSHVAQSRCQKKLIEVKLKSKGSFQSHSEDTGMNKDINTRGKLFMENVLERLLPQCLFIFCFKRTVEGLPPRNKGNDISKVEL